MSLPAGTRLGPYEVVSLIGAGGGAGGLTAVRVLPGPTFRTGPPRHLGGSGIGYGLSLDGQRVLTSKTVAPPPPPTEIHVIVNWIEEVKQKLAAVK